MNHNADHVTSNVDNRNKSADWGEAQLHSSADWGVEMGFKSCLIYLGLNYHTVHHLFPRICFSHHSEIQQILMDTCKEFKIDYHYGTFGEIYLGMIKSFMDPQSLYREV